MDINADICWNEKDMAKQYFQERLDKNDKEFSIEQNTEEQDNE